MSARSRPPFLIEPIVGWRVWTLGLETRGRSPMLLPAGNGRGAWPRQRALQARCHSPEERPKGHRPPTKSCSCGIYASDSLRSFIWSGPPPYTSVIGQASLWGKVIEHERGWRAAFAYPSRFRLICATCLEFGGGDARPSVARLATPSIVVAACEEHVDDLPDGRDFDPDVLQARLLSLYAVDLLPAESLEPFFEFAGRRPTPERHGQPDAAVSLADVNASTTAPGRAVVPAATVVPQASPRRSAAPTPEPLAIRALKAVGVGIAWLLQAAFFILLFFVGCADTFQVVSVQP